MIRPVPYRHAFDFAKGATTIAWLIVVGLSMTEAMAQRRPYVGPGTIRDVRWSEDSSLLSFEEEGRTRVVDTADFRDVIMPLVEVNWRPTAFHETVPSSSGIEDLAREDGDEAIFSIEMVGGETWLRHDGLDRRVYRLRAESTTYRYGVVPRTYRYFGQNESSWISPDGQKVVFYRFDFAGVNEHSLITGWTGLNPSVKTFHYPRAGEPIPRVALMLARVGSSTAERLQVPAPHAYLFGMRSTPDGRYLIVRALDRRQRRLTVLAFDWKTEKWTTVLEETSKTWQRHDLEMTFLNDGRTFVWETEKSGFKHFELRSVCGKLIRPLTAGAFECGEISRIDEARGALWYTAFSSPLNPYFLQVHVASLRETRHRRVTDANHHHPRFNLSPDGRVLIAQREQTHIPPTTVAYFTASGKVSGVLTRRRASPSGIGEMFEFRSGGERIFGVLHKPNRFSPVGNYPVIQRVYGGPSQEFAVSADYVADCHYENLIGYLVVEIANRGTGNRGRRFLDATYGQLGTIDVADQFRGIREIATRPYADESRVGIVGRSYGGYMASMAMLKHSAAYAAGVSVSGVSDWKNYIAPYTERYMDLPKHNPSGYHLSSTLASVRGRNRRADPAPAMLIIHGMIDENVHVTNTFQLVEELMQREIDHEMILFPTEKHSIGQEATTAADDFFRAELR